MAKYPMRRDALAGQLPELQPWMALAVLEEELAFAPMQMPIGVEV